MYKEIEGNLITLAKEGKFDVIVHGCNCFCTMGAGIAPQMAKAFGCDEFPLEHKKYKGDINKLGQIDFSSVRLLYKKEDTLHFKGYPNTLLRPNFEKHDKVLYVVNAYTQYSYGANHADGKAKPFDYYAFAIICRKLNHIFKGKHIGMPMIGAGLAGGNWQVIKRLIAMEIHQCDVTVVIYKP